MVGWQAIGGGGSTDIINGIDYDEDYDVITESLETDVTVPAGEVWKVTIGVGPLSYRSSVTITVNGDPVLKVMGQRDKTSKAARTTQLILTGGDTISASSGRPFISGVKLTEDYNIVSVPLRSGESITVPSGEDWHAFVNMTADDNSNTNYLRLNLNGQYFMSTASHAGTPRTHREHISFECFFKSGSTLSVDARYSGQTGVFITGIVL